ncbi:extracellular solute-binding protein [Frigoribacterium faeni]|uniref:Multiple sugar transport system substrate-binding protein n=1 Tax=Frigoribacterium faeni TaxID=145483 RepID=A0A7W3JFZ0_9MICO|nr:extracellular solute-binding protein [Frigoribacterium faeni]MBA8812162.1 multiple sugar transport system substrate-binding protein [Frigoribacterium faeni]GEK83741.1 sugar ABC transporter substrate-binding protein [Frigoribacterium faeni]
MRTKFRWIAALAVGVVAAGSMTACSASGSDGDSDTITYWASNQAPTVEKDAEILQESIDRYTEETGVKVDLEVIPWSDLYNRILTAVSSGEGPDVLNIGNTWAVSLQSSGAFVPWEGDALDAVGGQDRFVQSSFATGGAEGQAPTSVPLYGLAYSLYYNTAMFEAAGITDPPATWDEFVEDAKKLTIDTDGDGTIDQWGVTMAGSSISNNSHQAFVRGLQNGGALYDDSGEPDFANDGVVAGVKEWVDLMAVDKVVSPSDAESVNGSDMAATFADGQAAMFFDQAPDANLAARDFTDYAAAPVPMETADATDLLGTQSHVAGINISVFDNSDNKDAAIDFVKHLTSDDEQVYLNQAFSSLPVVTSAYDDPAFQSDTIKLKQVTLADHAQPMPLFPSEGQMETLVGTAIKGLLATAAQGGSVSEADVKSALEDANSQMSTGQ